MEAKWFCRSLMWIPIGKDVVMASSEKDLKDMDDLSEMAEVAEFGRKIIGLKIATKEGDNFGEIESFWFDEKNGLITHYTM
jgi:uncharacterized protein YrrD